MSDTFPASFLNYLNSINPELANKANRIACGLLPQSAMTNDEVDQYFIIKRKFDSL